MDIELNGAPHAVAENQNVQDLIASLDLANKSLAVAINREIVPRARWNERVLRLGDKVDIVKAIGGG
ncbi:sulfur carrier protein ThiS [Noviherbaspirillum galbum]|uniref:Sulfur carrier protein ThiS n=1 Tax=Noviherbaspirillum galbum TaxID=2709383 RepID=A0A6B3SZ22_9BURK|nr:sulfur carrier protein ThiS [Noviherbaspirillum galbum]NEX64262.1 sulfur carrier protein ThiS [Noviherbaspirillum galbum]